MLKNGTGGDAQGHACVVFLWDCDFIPSDADHDEKDQQHCAHHCSCLCRLYQMHLFGDHQLIANMSFFQTDSFNVMQNIIDEDVRL